MPELEQTDLLPLIVATVSNELGELGEAFTVNDLMNLGISSLLLVRISSDPYTSLNYCISSSSHW